MVIIKLIKLCGVQKTTVFNKKVKDFSNHSLLYCINLLGSVRLEVHHDKAPQLAPPERFPNEASAYRRSMETLCFPRLQH